jgi:hypothetical protein
MLYFICPFDRLEQKGENHTAEQTERNGHGNMNLMDKSCLKYMPNCVPEGGGFPKSKEYNALHSGGAWKPISTLSF